LIDRIIFGQENFQMRATFVKGVTSEQGSRFLGWRGLAQNNADRLQQFRLANGLSQIGGDAKFAAPRGVTQKSHGGEHHNGNPGEALILLHQSSQCEAIHVRHLCVQQNQAKGFRW